MTTRETLAILTGLATLSAAWLVVSVWKPLFTLAVFAIAAMIGG